MILDGGHLTRSAIQVGMLVIMLVVVVAGAASPTLADSRTYGTATESVDTQSSPDVSVSDITIGVNESGTADLSLSSAPNGLSGFIIVISTNSTTTATVTDASVASQFSLTNVTVAEDNSSVRFKATDLGDSVGPNSSDVRLGGIELTGESAGQASLTVHIERLDDDDGNEINALTDPGVVSIQNTSDDDAESDGRESGASDATANPTATAASTLTTAAIATSTPTAVSTATSTPVAVATATPTPTATPNLDTTAESRTPATTEGTGLSAPGFGAFTALMGLLGAVTLALRQFH